MKYNTKCMDNSRSHVRLQAGYDIVEDVSSNTRELGKGDTAKNMS